MTMRAVNPESSAGPTSLRFASANDRDTPTGQPWLRSAAILLAFVAGGFALFAIQRLWPSDAQKAIEPTGNGLVQSIPLASEDASLSFLPPAKPANSIAAGEAPAPQPAKSATIPPHATDVVVATGVTEPAPGRFAKLPLATSQAIAFVDVRPGDRVKKGYQVFSHWESPDRLQAVKAEAEKTKNMLEVAKARAAAAVRTVARLERLKTRATEQELEDAQTAATIRAQEVAGAELAVTEAERRFKGIEFEFNQAFVTSPIDGVVTAVDVVLGERRQVGNAFRGVTVLDARVLYCRCMLSLDQIERITPPKHSTDALAIRATAEAQGRKYEASVASIGAIADGSTGLVPVLIEVKNPDETLRVGVRADVTFAANSEAKLDAKSEVESDRTPHSAP